MPDRVVQGLVIGWTARGGTLETLRIEVNTCESSVICPSNKQDQSNGASVIVMQSRAATSEQRCIVVDRRCRESKGKAKIEGYMSISDEEAHHPLPTKIVTVLSHIATGE